MYPAVAVAFDRENRKLEGVIRWMYLDVKGLVTCAIGYLIDDGSGVAPESALILPWKHIDGTTATYDEIRAAWSVVKARQDLAGIGGGKPAFEELTDLRLDDAGMTLAEQGWAKDAEVHLRHYFPGYDSTQADAQLGILLMAYALGSAFAPGYPKFAAAMNALVPRFDVAAAECAISTRGNPGVADRDADIKVMFENAARAQAAGTPYDVLWWPNTYPPSDSGGGGLASGGGNLLGRVVMGVLASLTAWAGWQAYQHRGEISASVRRGNRAIERQVRRLAP